MKKEKKLRNSAKAVIIQNGKLLVIEKKDGNSRFCVLPGGGQEKTENLRETLIREVVEEVGAKVEVGTLLHVREYVSEDHFPRPDLELRQVEFFFECKLLEDYEPKNGIHPDQRQQKVKWVKLEELDRVNFYPVCLQESLRNYGEGDSLVYLGECN